MFGEPGWPADGEASAPPPRKRASPSAKCSASAQPSGPCAPPPEAAPAPPAPPACPQREPKHCAACAEFVSLCHALHGDAPAPAFWAALSGTGPVARAFGVLAQVAAMGAAPEGRVACAPGDAAMAAALCRAVGLATDPHEDSATSVVARASAAHSALAPEAAEAALALAPEAAVGRPSAALRLETAVEQRDAAGASAALAALAPSEGSARALAGRRVFPTSDGRWCDAREALVPDDAEVVAMFPADAETKYLFSHPDPGTRDAAWELARRCGAREASEAVAWAVAGASPLASDSTLALFVRAHARDIQRHCRAHCPAYAALPDLRRAARMRNIEFARAEHLMAAAELSGRRSEPRRRAAVLTASKLVYEASPACPAYSVEVFRELSRVFCGGCASWRLTHLLALLAAGATAGAEFQTLLGPELPPGEPLWDVAISAGASVPVNVLATVPVRLGASLGLRPGVLAPLWEVTLSSVRGPVRIQGPKRPDGGANARNLETGLLGEQIAYKWLREQHGAPGTRVVWTNERTDSGLPYDAFVTLPNGETHYYEVKSTDHASKMSFEITWTELQFALDKEDKYHILRVMQVRQPSVSIAKLGNPWQVLKDHAASLVMTPL
eukprot:m51a1_g10410 hypothetical protein (615) ;mRNA; f:63399-65384